MCEEGFLLDPTEPWAPLSQKSTPASCQVPSSRVRNVVEISGQRAGGAAQWIPRPGHPQDALSLTLWRGRRSWSTARAQGASQGPVRRTRDPEACTPLPPAMLTLASLLPVPRMLWALLLLAASGSAESTEPQDTFFTPSYGPETLLRELRPDPEGTGQAVVLILVMVALVALVALVFPLACMLGLAQKAWCPEALQAPAGGATRLGTADRKSLDSPVKGSPALCPQQRVWPGSWGSPSFPYCWCLPATWLPKRCGSPPATRSRWRGAPSTSPAPPLGLCSAST
ncbi:T-cell antigen CD7 isoform X7 [Camelus ferus]|uniref:T-cell antigen CD7 isoform X7 n=1 Tax=Camelus ferus TaxID=419612 RepID=A0A8B8UL78_CAMFR|nr:T-cell antigen CD7 isoform X7 [Camelus ferus]